MLRDDCLPPSTPPLDPKLRVMVGWGRVCPWQMLERTCAVTLWSRSPPAQARCPQALRMARRDAGQGRASPEPQPQREAEEEGSPCARGSLCLHCAFFLIRIVRPSEVCSAESAFAWPPGGRPRQLL